MHTLIACTPKSRNDSPHSSLGSVYLSLSVAGANDNVQAKLDAYRCGYQNGMIDMLEFIEKYSGDARLRQELVEYVQDRQIELKNLTGESLGRTIRLTSPVSSLVIPERKPTDRLQRTATCSASDAEVTRLPAATRETKVPSFVLHPSGTHYIPICIDASLISEAFASGPSRSSPGSDQVQCHPISIPVNFHPIVAPVNASDIDIQNINVIGTRHQTSVRPH